MMGQILQFRVRSGGTISVALEQCAECTTRACVVVCESQGGPLVWNVERKGPGLRWSEAEVERGGCVECLGCELDCTLTGRQAVTIHLPIARLEEYLDILIEPVVYER
jgi:hypothetical protein